ncbi:serine protease [Persicobacter diffluens]|uniref:Serine protease n=1 Tax=Persicobacter diffluens TaxID=981 RepID=A0AAN4VZW4_9BACT|nr:hypothetical protein PEDI_30940 [Persicobacter diffluens]
MEFFEQMDVVLRTYWYVALPTSLIFIIQTVMSFMGIDGGDGMEAEIDFDADADIGGDDIGSWFSIKNLINFLLGFSWTGISFYTTISNTILLIILSIAVGVGFVWLFFVVMKQMMKLGEDNSFKPAHALFHTAEVYLPIPGYKEGKGKVTVSVKGSSRELDAITLNQAIPAGEAVKIVALENEDLLIVESL